MILETLPQEHRKIFEKKGVASDIDFSYMFPTRFYDFTKRSYVNKDAIGSFGCFKGVIKKIKKNDVHKIITCELTECDTEQPFQLTVFSTREYDWYCSLKEKEIYICGKLTENTYTTWQGEVITSLVVSAPFAVSEYKSIMRIHKVYPKHKGMSAEYKEKVIKQALIQNYIKETIPSDLLQENDLMTKTSAIFAIHNAESLENVRSGIKRILAEDLTYFFAKLEMEQRGFSNTSNYITHKVGKSMQTVLDYLPYDLTDDQKQVLKTMIHKTSSGERLNTLVQGDVGCGKSIIAFLMMLVFADNGYQSVLMAPTQVLAEQHALELSNYASLCGYEVVFLHGSLSAKERKTALAKISSGEAKLIVGTHSVISDDVCFQSLALTIIDEEHRFGVEQRDKLSEKAKEGVHTISFSATPIPRSFAKTIYGKTTIEDIKTMPSGRSPVKTKVVAEERLALNMAEKVISEGSQVYVVCPLIETDDEDNKLRSVKQTAKVYEERLGLEVGVVSGRESKKSISETLQRFKSGELKVLVATTVVEVGVNVPNATLITINDAYMFGLAGLHQLRGRVGRGQKQGYCILLSDRDSERLKIMESTTDGFQIAEEDLKLRGAGNLLGEEQSGKHRFLTEVLANPELAKTCKNIAIELVNRKQTDTLFEEMERRSEKIYCNAEKTKIR